MMTTVPLIELRNYTTVSMEGQEKYTSEPSLPVRSIVNTTCSIRSACRGVSHWMWKNKGKFALGALCMAGSYMGSLLGTSQANTALAKKVDEFGRRVEGIGNKEDGIERKLDLLGDSLTLNFSDMSEEDKQNAFATATMQTPIQPSDNTTASIPTNNTAKCENQYYQFMHDGSIFHDFDNVKSFGLGYHPSSGSKGLQPVVMHKVNPGELVSCYVEVDNALGIPSDEKPHSILNSNGTLIFSEFEETMGENNLVVVHTHTEDNNDNDVEITELINVPGDCESIKQYTGVPPCEDDKLIWGDTNDE